MLLQNQFLRRICLLSRILTILKRSILQADGQPGFPPRRRCCNIMSSLSLKPATKPPIKSHINWKLNMVQLPDRS
ncbi:unnamed protein product [Parnassius apollo]|uniref:(apollo) hypothetical protein n=1 Tax=Parnassius apollo TaxID=110799 RepID=A0A8S3XUY7_PARAO|nr:unnamed protein product [Parnassius apollo]